MASTIAEAAEKAFTAFEAKQPDTPEPDSETEAADDTTAEPDGQDPYGELTSDEPDDVPDDSSDAETPPPLANRIEVTEDDLIVLPDGSEVSIKDSALRQADYTKKTQQLANERKQTEALRAEADQILQGFEDWYQNRAANPDKWIVEIAGSLPDRGVRTQMIARALRDLAASGYLEDDFVETFGLTSGPAAAFAEEKEQDRIAKLEDQLRQQEEAREIELRVRQRAAVLQGQWDDIKSSYGMSFTTTQEEFEAKKEVLEFARQNDISNLRVAFDAMQGRRQTATPPRLPDAATTEKKRASRAIAQKSKSAGQIAPPEARAKSIRAAAELALDKYLGA